MIAMCRVQAVLMQVFAGKQRPERLYPKLFEQGMLFQRPLMVVPPQNGTKAARISHAHCLQAIGAFHDQIKMVVFARFDLGR